MHVHDVYTQPSGSNPLGQISGGLLTLSCSVLLRCTTTNKENLDAEHQEEFERNIPHPAALNFDGDTTIARIHWDVEEDHSGLLYFLPISEQSSRSNTDSSKQYKRIDGLVLRKTVRTKNIGQYSRLGVFEVESGWWDSSRHIYENFLAIMVKQKDITPMADFARTLDQNEKFPEECHLIEII